MTQSKLSLSVFTACCLQLILPATLHAQDQELHIAQKAVRMQDFDRAFKLYSALANNGNADAQNQLANMLLKGMGTQKNEPAAILWLKKAAAQSHAGAQFTLSQLLNDDPEQARELLKTSANQGYTPAKTWVNRSPSQPNLHALSSFETQWFGAARNNQQSLMKDLLTDKNQLNTLDRAGRNALFYAAEFNSGETLSWLIAQGIDVNHRDNNGLTAMQTALARNHTAIIERLLKAGSDPTQTFSNGDNLLHYAIRLHHFAQVEPLLSTHTPINQQNNDGWTALDLAEFQKSNETIAILKKNGAKNGSGWQRDKAKQNVAEIARQLEVDSRLSPAAMAIINNNSRLLAEILQKAPDLANTPIDNGYTLLILATKLNKPKMIATLLEQGASINHTSHNDTSALHVAVRLGYPEVVSALLAAGASPTQIDKDSKDAISSAISEGQAEIANLLIDHILGDNKDVNEARNKLKINSIPINNYILLAAQHQADAVVDRLLPFANSTPTFDKQQRSALWYATKHSNPKMIEKLLKAGISASLVDSLGRTPLIMAVEQGCLECAKLLRAGSDLNHQTTNGNTPLILAAIVNNTEMSAWLIQNKADIEARNNRGNTALMVAVSVNSFKIAQQLIDAKANPARKNKLGFSAMDFAEKAGPEMVTLLQKNLVFGVF